jgi:hypothetical protein
MLGYKVSLVARSGSGYQGRMKVAIVRGDVFGAVRWQFGVQFEADIVEEGMGSYQDAWSLVLMLDTLSRVRTVHATPATSAPDTQRTTCGTPRPPCHPSPSRSSSAGTTSTPGARSCTELTGSMSKASGSETSRWAHTTQGMTVRLAEDVADRPQTIVTTITITTITMITG